MPHGELRSTKWRAALVEVVGSDPEAVAVVFGELVELDVEELLLF